MSNRTPTSWATDESWKHGLMEPTTAANPAALPRKCRHPRDRRVLLDNGQGCGACGHYFDPIVTRRGRRNKYRGLSIQRQVAEMADMQHIPGNGPADARDTEFNAEIKSGSSWYSTRVEAELDALPAGRSPLFIAASTPGPGRTRRVYAVVTLGDLVKMIGPHAQVHTWLPEWVALKQAAGVTRE